MMVVGQGPFTKKLQNKNEKMELKSTLVLSDNNLHGFLGHFVQSYFGRCGLDSCLDRGGNRGSQKTQEGMG